MLKDLTLAIEAAESVKCKVELGETSKKIYQQITDKGMGRKDFGIIYDLILKNKA
jgi:3-hydroxyisobutyrate dehydrogenase-like beta-hydroxyacid dehydrogenase